MYKNCKLVAECGGKQVFSKKFMVLAPGEMGSFDIDRSALDGDMVVRLER